MNLGDPELELIDPTPNIHALFIQFDKMFFNTKLASRVVVRWSKRMYSCAGICSYEGRGGLCDIALSEPLLKLRPRKDLVETLLHEMIHAYLFVTCRDQDRDGHGPNFKAHMHRINQFAGLNISIYHSFHDEVKLYQTHWWRCNGPCQQRRPHFGIVRRPNNRAPGKYDYWWEDHKRKCGGTFIKIKEPENYVMKTAKPKSNSDITKYTTTNKKTNINNNNNNVQKPILKDLNNVPVKSKSNNTSTAVISKKEPVFNPQYKPPMLFQGKSHVINNEIQRSKSSDVIRTVRNVWANKQISETVNSIKPNEAVKNIWAKKQIPSTSNKNNEVRREPNKNFNSTPNISKHKAEPHINSPPAKVKKIDDYFRSTATSILKDLYGQNIEISQDTGENKKLKAITHKTGSSNSQGNNKKIVTTGDVVETLNNMATELVDCPVCHSKVDSNEVNRHLDECLNKELIQNIHNEMMEEPSVRPSPKDDKIVIKDIEGDLPSIPPFRPKVEKSSSIVQMVERASKPKSDKNKIFNTASIEIKDNKVRNNTIAEDNFDSTDVNKVQTIVKKINYDKQVRRKSENFITQEEKDKFLNDVAVEFNKPFIESEPTTSKDVVCQFEPKCACCGNKLDKPLEQHLDECLAFFANNNTEPEEGVSTSFANETIVIDDDDDIFDETQTFNATGTKSPCPCCLTMIEEAEINQHLDICLS